MSRSPRRTRRSTSTDRIIPDQVTVRVGGSGHSFPQIPAEQVAYMDVSPKQVVSVATALIPFLEHDDANRALMGANMQRQAVPLVRPRSPIVGTGVEHQAAKDSGQVLVSRHNGTVKHVNSPSGRHRRRRRHRARLQPAQVRALEPGHVHQPAAQRQQGRPGDSRADRG